MTLPASLFQERARTMLCRPVFALVILVSSTYAASPYNIPLLQETLEIIGGDLINSVTNMINGGEYKADLDDSDEKVKPLFKKKNGQAENDDDDDQAGNKITENEEDKSSRVQDTGDDKLETNTEAPDTEASGDDKDAENDEEESGSDEQETPVSSSNTDEETDKSTKKEVEEHMQDLKGKKNDNSDNKDSGDANAEDNTAEDDNEEDENPEEEEEDEAKVLAATVVNMAKERIQKKLEDLELIN